MQGAIGGVRRNAVSPDVAAGDSRHGGANWVMEKVVPEKLPASKLASDTMSQTLEYRMNSLRKGL